jgi:hypothetical protein
VIVVAAPTVAGILRVTAALVALLAISLFCAPLHPGRWVFGASLLCLPGGQHAEQGGSGQLRQQPAPGTSPGDRASQRVEA